MTRWRESLEKLWCTNRVHVSRATSQAYRDLADIYPNTEVFGFKSGEKSGSWVAPQGWEVQSARLTGPKGEIICDWDKNKLSLYTYSPSFTGLVKLDELQKHLFSIPSQPERTPFHFRNQYRHWAPEWGFCLSQNEREKLIDGEYYVEIKTSLENQTMEMAEQVHRGESTDSILLVGHFDHPYMCNDGLVGCLAGHEILTRLGNRKTKLTYRMLSTVEIIGSVFYAQHQAKQNNVKEALFVAMSGASTPMVYQTSFAANSTVDRVMKHLLGFRTNTTVAPFRDPKGFGNDETAFDVAGVNIPCGSIQRAAFAEYHTDIDIPENVNDGHVEEMIELVLESIDVIEKNSVVTANFKGLPCLSHPELDLYLPPAARSKVREDVPPIVEKLCQGMQPMYRDHVMDHSGNLNSLMTLVPIMANGESTTLDISERAGLPFWFVDHYLKMWEEKGLVELKWSPLKS